MILMIRIDDRLLHGQVAYSWKAGLGYDAIVIADDEVSNDDFRKSVLKMATPPEVKLAIRDIEGATELLNNPKLAKAKVFVIVNSPKNAYRLYQQIAEKPAINLGGMMMSEGRKEFAKAVFINEEDLKYLDLLHQLPVEIDVRQTPSEAKQKYADLRNKIEF